MFGFGKKKNEAMLAEKYAVNMVTLSISMKNSFVQIWNSYRHIADLEAISIEDRDMFNFFAFYNTISCREKVFHKIDDKEISYMFSGFCDYLYVDSFKSLGMNLPSEFSLKSHTEVLLDISKQFTNYSKNNPKDSLFEELTMFFVYHLKELPQLEQHERFCSEIYPHFESLHNEGWGVIKASKSYPVVTDSLLETYNSIKNRLPH
tara:strand:- start:387 stop:1001 length:615 start_codon:yes stop_codon:yes gene_type:complete